MNDVIAMIKVIIMTIVLGIPAVLLFFYLMGSFMIHCEYPYGIPTCWHCILRAKLSKKYKMWAHDTWKFYKQY